MDTLRSGWIGKFRKKPVEIEAMQFEYTPECLFKLKMWAGDAIGDVYKARTPNSKAELQVCTLEDGQGLKVKHIATEGDWIIRGVQGEYYACKPDIFEQTYESSNLVQSVFRFTNIQSGDIVYSLDEDCKELNSGLWNRKEFMLED